MSVSKVSSQITFLYFDDFSAACSLFEEVLELEIALDVRWARVFRTGIGEIKALKDIGLKSFLINGPEGYVFEVQEFLKPELRELFLFIYATGLKMFLYKPIRVFREP